MKREEAASQSIRHLSKVDRVMGRLIAQVGPCGLKKHRGGFETMAEIIVAQQLSTQVATAIFGRLKAAAGGRLTPKVVLDLSDAEMRQAGLSRGKVAYLRDLAKKTLDGTVSFRKLPQLPDEDVISMLTQVKGIGRWTTEMYLIFVLGRPDVFSPGDKGLQAAIARHYGVTNPKADLAECSERWKPYRSTACWYLWRSLRLAKKTQATTRESARYTR